MIKNYLTQVRRLKGVLSEREAFVSRAAQATEAACIYEFVWIEQLIEIIDLTMCMTNTYTFKCWYV